MNMNNVLSTLAGSRLVSELSDNATSILPLEMQGRYMIMGYCVDFKGVVFGD